MNSFGEKLRWGALLALAFGVSAHVYADELVCPSKKELYRACENDPSKNRSLRTDFFSTEFDREKDRCLVYNQSVIMKDWPYAPLEEFTGLALDGLMEGLPVEEVFDSLGKFPAPPMSKVTSSEIERPACHRASEAESKQLTLRMGDLNLKSIPQGLLKELETYCLAFKVGVETWKRMMVSVTDAYVIPLGEINLVVAGRTEEAEVPAASSDELFPTTETNYGEAKLVYRAIGSCEVGKDPVTCVEDLLTDDWNDFRYAFEGGQKKKMKALPFRARPDAIQNAWGGRFNGITDVTIEFGDDGGLTFLVDPIKGRNRKLYLSVRDGNFALETGEAICNPPSANKRLVYLRLLAYPKAQISILEQTSLYSASDFPAPKRNRPNGNEIGCATGSDYTEWATDTANSAKHFLWLGMETKALYDWIASERQLWNLKGNGVTRAKQELVFGAPRRGREETIILEDDPLEPAAIAYVQRAKQVVKGFAVRTGTVDKTPVSETWYYPKGAVGYRRHGEPVNTKIVIKHLPIPTDILQAGFYERAEQIKISCGTTFQLKEEMTKAMFTYYHLAPLQQGDELVGKVFFAALYAKVFGQKMEVREFGDINIDALIMNEPEFIQKYLPRL